MSCCMLSRSSIVLHGGEFKEFYVTVDANGDLQGS